MTEQKIGIKAYPPGDGPEFEPEEDEIDLDRALEIIEQQEMKIRNLNFLLSRGIEISFLEGFAGGVDACGRLVRGAPDLQRAKGRLNLIANETTVKIAAMKKEIYRENESGNDPKSDRGSEVGSVGQSGSGDQRSPQQQESPVGLSSVPEESGTSMCPDCANGTCADDVHHGETP